MTEIEAREELLEARRVMCRMRTGRDMLERIIPTLGWLLLNAPTDAITSLTMATIYEAERRSAYLPWTAQARPTKETT